MGRRIRGTHAEDVRHDPLASGHRRGSFRLACCREKRPFAYQPASYVDVRTEHHAPELASLKTWNAIMLGQTFVDERVVRAQQINDTAVFSNDTVEKQLDLAPHRLRLTIVKRANYDSVIVRDGDRIEIVNFVGGGTA